MRVRSLALAALLSSLSGCIIVDTGPGGPSPANYPLHRILPGVGAFDPGYDGAIITANVGPGGQSFRVTWDTTWEGFTIIEGIVYATSLSSPQFTPGCTDGSCTLTARDRVYLDGYSVAFRGYPGSPVRSGFDIVIPLNDELVVDISFNGIRDPRRVTFTETTTRRAATPQSIPFRLTTR